MVFSGPWDLKPMGTSTSLNWISSQGCTRRLHKSSRHEMLKFPSHWQLKLPKCELTLLLEGFARPSLGWLSLSWKWQIRCGLMGAGNFDIANYFVNLYSESHSTEICRPVIQRKMTHSVEPGVYWIDQERPSWKAHLPANWGMDLHWEFFNESWICNYSFERHA